MNADLLDSVARNPFFQNIVATKLHPYQGIQVAVKLGWILRSQDDITLQLYDRILEGFSFFNGYGTELTPKTLDNATKVTLQRVCRHLRLKVSGTKEDLTRRVQGWCGTHSCGKNVPVCVSATFRDFRMQYRLIQQRREQQRRRELLQGALRQRGLQLRADSRMCSQFIYDGQRNVAEVVDMMEEMQFFFDHTNYRHVFTRLRIENLDLDFPSYRRRPSSEISREAKDLALEEWCRGQTAEECLSGAPSPLRDRIDHFFRQRRV